MQTLQTSKQTFATHQEDILFTSHHPVPVSYLTDSVTYLLRKVEPRLILCAFCLCRPNTLFARHRAAASRCSIVGSGTTPPRLSLFILPGLSLRVLNRRPWSILNMSTIKSVPSSRLAMGSAQATTRLAGKASRKRVADEAKANTPLKSARRKRNHTPVELVDLTDEGIAASPAKKPKSAKKTKTSDEPAPERRARVFRNHPPKTYLDRVARARSQR